jgi:hypothetical protein
MEIEKAKTHARRLEAFLKSQGVKLPYSACLEAVAHVEGVANWQTLEAQTHKQPIAVSVEHLSGIEATNFFELPFMHPNSEWPLIRTILIADSLKEEERGIRTYHDIHTVNEELFAVLAKESRGEELDEDDNGWLENGDDEIILDWGDEYEGEGLTVDDLRGLKQVGDGIWQLTDGRKLELFANGKVVVPLQKQKDKRKNKRKA